MRIVRIGLFSVSLFCSVHMPVFTRAQDSASVILDSVSVPKKQSYLASYWQNGVGLLASPVHWKGETWAAAAASIMMTGVVIAMDEPLTQPFLKWQTNFGNAFGDVGYVIGSVPFQLGISVASLGIGAIARSQPLKDFALDNLQAQVYTGGITLLVKELTHRARPIEGEGAYAWYGPFEGAGNQSFFSGHSSLAFSTATMVFLHSHKKWWVGVLSYGIASGVAVSRMQRQAHWASDVLFGAIIGSAISNFVYRQQEKRRHPQQLLKTLP
jgi:membrane-associated phospholipid phosphatase